MGRRRIAQLLEQPVEGDVAVLCWWTEQMDRERPQGLAEHTRKVALGGAARGVVSTPKRFGRLPRPASTPCALGEAKGP